MCLSHSPSTKWCFPCTPDPCTYERAWGAEQRQIERVENKYKYSLKIKSNHSFDAALGFQLPCPSIAVLPFKFAQASRVISASKIKRLFTVAQVKLWWISGISEKLYGEEFQELDHTYNQVKQE